MKILREKKSINWEACIECPDCHSELVFNKNDLNCEFHELEKNMFTTHLEYYEYNIVCPVCLYKINIDESHIHPIIRRELKRNI